MKRKITAALLALVLVLSLAGAAFAAVQKDEVVYARLDGEGQAKAVYVVNAFESDNEAEVLDYGRYLDARPLGGAGDFTYRDGEAAFTMPAGRFSYEGSAVDTALPWSISLSFTLDGEAMDYARLPGANGHLEGSLKVSVNEALRAYANSLSLQITLTLDGGRARNIQADKATYAIAAGQRTLSFVVLPGQEAEYTFSADVRDFAMPGFQAAGVRMGMDTAMYQNVAAAAFQGSPLQGAITGMMDTFMAGMQGMPVQSFTDGRNAVRSVQFVLMGPEVPELKAEVSPPPDEKPGNLWERFKAIFGM